MYNIVKELIITVLLGLLSIIVMACKGNFYSFLNYVLLGMKDFAGNNLKIQETVEIVIIAYGLIAIMSYLLTFLLFKSKEIDDRNIITILIFAAFLNLSSFPIFNLYHTSFAILLNIIIFIYVLDILLIKKVKNKKILKVCIVITYIVINIFCINCGLQTEENVKIEDKRNVYYSANISKKLYQNMEETIKYILQKEAEGIDVICISSDAALYMTPIKKSHRELDLIFEGNLGYMGKENTIDKIKQLDKVEILMNKNIEWQELTELREYVIVDYQRIGTVGDCYIFKK